MVNMFVRTLYFCYRYAKCHNSIGVMIIFIYNQLELDHSFFVFTINGFYICLFCARTSFLANARRQLFA